MPLRTRWRFRRGVQRPARKPGVPPDGRCGRSKPLWPVACLVGVFACELAGAGALQADLAEELARSVHSARSVARELSVHVVSLPGGDPVYSYSGDTPRIIASNTKLITTAAALDRLGAGFFHETAVFIEGKHHGRVLTGNLAVRGDGDPNVSGRFFEGDSLAVFRTWARKLRVLGIEEITGDVFLVDGLFDDVQVHPDWPKDQLSRWYEAPVAALSFRDNCVLVRVFPGTSVGARARVEVVSGLGLFEVETEVRTIGSSRHHWLAVDRKPGTNVIQVRGMVLEGVDPIDVWVSVNDPIEYFGAAMIEAFAREGVVVRGSARATERFPSGGWFRVAEHRTGILTTLEVINQRSQNFYSESLIKLLGAKLCGRGSWQAGIEVLNEFLAAAGVPSGYELSDGSGMSRGNRFSAAQLTRLLSYMFEHRFAREFVLTLPYSGFDDHHRWRNRLAEAPYRERVFAKTGSLSGVSTLSGYAKSRSGRVYAFSILGNRVRSIWRARRAQDSIVRALIDHG